MFFGYQDEYPKDPIFPGIMVKPRRFRILSTGSRDLEATGHWGTRQGGVISGRGGVGSRLFWEIFLEIIHSEELEGWRKTKK